MNDANAAVMESLMISCLGCRRCLKVCPSYANGGCDPYYVMHGWDGNVRACIGCGKCSEICPATDPKTVMMLAKAEALNLPVPEAFSEYGYVIAPADPSWKEGLPEIPSGNDMYLLPGCIVNGKLPYLKYAAAAAFRAVGVGIKELPDNKCCMYPVPLRSMTDTERNSVKYRMRSRMQGRDAVTLCAGCCNEFARAGVYAPHVSTVFARYLDRIRELPGLKGLKVALEPGCAAERFISDFEAAVRATGAEPVGNRYGCCGKNIPGVKDALMKERQAECADADVIVAGCPNCMLFYDSVPDGKPILHLTELIALAAGDAETQRFHRLKIGPAKIKN